MSVFTVIFVQPVRTRREGRKWSPTNNSRSCEERTIFECRLPPKMKEWTYLGFLAQYNRRMIVLAEGRESSLGAVVARAKEGGPVEMVDHLVAHQLTSLHHKSSSSAGTDKESKVPREWNSNLGMYCINASPDNCWPRPIWDIVVQVKSKKSFYQPFFSVVTYITRRLSFHWYFLY